MIRFLALQLIKKDKTLILKFANIVVSSKNRVRLLTRTLGSIAIGVVGALVSIFPVAIFLTVFYFYEIENCGYNYEAHFQKLPQNQPIEIYTEHQNGNLIISGNDDARQVEIYTPSNSENIFIESKKVTGEKIVRKSYKPTSKKAKEVLFSEFQKTDPVLSQFKNLDEPHIPKKSCNLPPEDLHNLINIRID